MLRRLPAAARGLGIDVVVFEVREAAEFETVFAAAARQGMQALFVSQSPLFSSNRARVTAIATGVRLPAIYGFREFAEAGGLMSYGANLPAIYRRAAGLVDKILKGAKPGRPADRSADPVRADRQPQGCEGDRTRHPGLSSCRSPTR